MAKATEVREQDIDRPQDGRLTVGDMYFLALPVQTYKMLSDAAAARGMTFAQALERAINVFLESPGDRKMSER